MDKRFTEIKPQVTKVVKYGAEPSLNEILAYFYTSHGISFEEAKTLAESYILAWVKEELDFHEKA